MRARLKALLCTSMIIGGATLLYFASFITIAEILPQVSLLDWSLAGSNLILNREWRGNQLYLLVGNYLLSGESLLTGAVWVWRRGKNATAHPG